MSGDEVLFVRNEKKNKSLSGDDEDDVWDDTLLIQAYDRAINIAHNQVLRKMQSSSEKEADNSNSTKKFQWKTGDKCRCKYSEDQNFYEADIIDIIDDVGMCIVKYVGYENEEKVPLQSLKPSKGEIARSMQIHQALEDNNQSDLQAEKDVESKFRQQKKKRNSGGGSRKGRRKEKFIPSNNSCFDPKFTSSGPPEHMSIPPPPPPHLFGNLSNDVSESEAMSAMLMSWYMSGYHTGFYQGLKTGRRK